MTKTIIDASVTHVLMSGVATIDTGSETTNQRVARVSGRRTRGRACGSAFVMCARTAR